MDFEIPNRWVVLQVEKQRSGLKITAHDDRRRRRSDRSQGEITLRNGQRVVTFPVPLPIVRLIEEALADLPQRRVPPHGQDPISLPLFLKVGPRLRQEADIADPGLPEDLAKRVQTVELAPRRGALRPPFRLPLTVLLLEPGLEGSLFASSGWYQEESVRRHGLQLETLSSVPPQVLREALRKRAWDVVVARGPKLLDVLSAMEKPSEGRGRPRLVIGAGEEVFRRRATRDIPAGIALFWLGNDFAGEQGFLEEFLYGMIHDYPLHDAFRMALSKRLEPDIEASLIAGPRSNQGLRLSNAVGSLADEAVVLSAPDPARLTTLLWSREPRTQILNPAQMRDLAEKIGFELSTAKEAEVEFAHERSGLVPLAVAETHLAEARRQKSKLDQMLRTAARSPKVAAEIRARQERRVDAALQSLENVPVRALAPDQTLRRDALYRLRVHVGHRSEESLVTGEPPPLDPLLPPTRRRQGHTLHIVVYEKDFELLTPRIQVLHLPDLGGSHPVYFDLRAPQRDGPARLRFKVYHRNQFLQSFLLEAVIADREERVSKSVPALRVDLVYSRTARFTNLKSLKPRALSVGVNQDPDSGLHLFMFKVGKSAEAIDISEKILDEQIGRFRKLLLAATYEGKQPRFLETLASETLPSEAFYEVIRNLADAGSDLYDALFVRMSRVLKRQMREVARNADRTIQLVRDDPNFVFPWSILYDFKRPEWPEGGAPPPVCLGFQEAKPCSHGPEDGAYCIKGFWGIRHALEVLLARGGVVEDEVPTVKRESREAAVCLALGVEDDFTRGFVAEMEALLGTGIRTVSESEDLLDLLWDKQKRPALLIVLGHLETRVIKTEPRGPRIVLASRKKWFLARSVTDREKKDGEWEEQPRSVVLMMACGTAATEVSTLNNFVTALSSAGAAAVVGTECLVFTNLVTRFARDLISDLWEGKITLGQAIQGFRRRLVTAGNPLGFVFSATGNADLVFDLKG